MLRRSSCFLALTVLLVFPGCDADDESESAADTAAGTESSPEELETLCADDAPPADVACGDISDEATEQCALDALAAGSSFSVNSSMGGAGQQFDSSTQHTFIGDLRWTRTSGVEDLCTLDSLELIRTEGLDSCESLDCILDAGVDFATCFDYGDCDAV